MKYLKIFTAGFLCFAFANVFAQTEKPPKPAPPKDFILPGKTQFMLPNKMKVTAVEFGNIPKAFIALEIKAGGINENADQVWLSKLVANMMEEGTATMSASEIAKKAAELGGSINVDAGTDNFTITGSCLSQYVKDMIALISDVVLRPKLPASELDRLKANLKRELAVAKEVPQSIATAKFEKLMFGEESPYGRTFPTEEMLNSYTIDDVKQFYNTNLGAQRSALYIAGLFEKSGLQDLITSKFGNWKTGSAVDYPKDDFTYQPTVTIIDRPGAPQTTIMMGLPVIDPTHPDYVAMDITNSLLGGSFGSRITSNIRENKGYTYSPGSSLQVQPGSGIWYEEADVTSEHTIDAIQEIKNEIHKLAGTPPPANELMGIKKYEAGIFLLQNSTPGGIIYQLRFLDRFGLPESYLTNRVKNIYAVSPEQVSSLVKKYLDPEKMTIVMVGDEQQIKKQQESK